MKTTINVDFERDAEIKGFRPIVILGHGKLGGSYVTVVHVVSANAYTIPLTSPVNTSDALALAAAVSEWDIGMADCADAPFHSSGPDRAAREVIRKLLPNIADCHFRDLFTDTYDLHVPAPVLR